MKLSEYEQHINTSNSFKSVFEGEASDVIMGLGEPKHFTFNQDDSTINLFFEDGSVQISVNNQLKENLKIIY